MLLRDIHTSLSAHFAGLAEQRRETNSPVFALEHGLTPDGVEGLKHAIQEHLRTSAPDESDWLAWVVYATEIGYDFEGHEYWQTFEEETEKWKVRGERAFIRRCFWKFVQSCNGFTPSGVWADHFNIIAYPITHAILPKDFQYQFSRVIYGLRAYISPSLIESPRLLGKKISENCFDESKRFQRFAQNFDLVGLIAREILTVDELGSDNVIIATTFRRIIADLRKQDEAAFFLDQTRSAIKDRPFAKVRRPIQMSPRVALRRAGPELWDVLVEIPDLQQLSELSDEAEQFLTTAKPRILGSMGDARLARGRLVNYGTTQQTLASLPSNQAQIVHFRRELPPSLEEIFRKQLVFHLPSITLFRVHSRGFAIQMDSRTLSPKNKYLVLSREPLNGRELLHPLKTSCRNAYIYSLRPEWLTDPAHEDALRDLNLQLEIDCDFVPLAPYPLNCSDGTRLEYLDGESPCFAIKIDKPWKAIRIQLEDFDVIDIVSTPEPGFAFFTLPALSTGLYNLSYKVSYNSGFDFEDLGEVSIYVKDRTVWRPGTSGQNALILLLDPPKPSFELLLDGKVEFDVLSPETSASVVLRLLPKNSSEPPLFTKSITTATLPSEINRVNEEIAKIVGDPKVLELSELTHLCQIEFRCDELGSVNVDFRRELNPLRWDVKYSGGQSVLLNLSEAGDEQVDIVRYNFANPDVAVKLDSEACFPDYCVPNDGGLIVAVTPRQKKGIVILKEDKIKAYKSFSDIGKDDGFEPEFRSWTQKKEDLATLVDLYSVWATSRTVGGVFSKRDLRKVLDGFRSTIVCLIDDYQWKRCEQDYLTEPSNRRKKRALLFAVSQKTSIRTGLENLVPQDLSSDRLVDAFATVFKLEVTPEKLVRPRKSTLVTVIKTLGHEWFVEFALRLCSRPESLRSWCQTNEKFEIGLKKVMENPSLVRAARFVILTLRQEGRYKWDWE
jgi:hypothetical protein